MNIMAIGVEKSQFARVGDMLMMQAELFCIIIMFLLAIHATYLLHTLYNYRNCLSSTRSHTIWHN